MIVDMVVMLAVLNLVTMLTAVSELAMKVTEIMMI